MAISVVMVSGSMGHCNVEGIRPRRHACYSATW